MTDHPITPPPELIRQWMERTEYDEHTWFYESYIAIQAARWGADQELEACCKLLDGAGIFPPDGAKTYPENLSAARERMGKLRAARRPKPPSLKDQALAELELLRGDANAHGLGFDSSAIRRALEALDD